MGWSLSLFHTHDASNLDSCVLSGAVDTLLADPSMILLAVGILMFSITFVGCLGALRDLTLLLKMVQ